MDLITFQNEEWKDRKATFPFRKHISRDSTLSGKILYLVSFFNYAEVDASHEKWIRTDIYVFPYMKLFPTTYWVYKYSEDKLVQIVFNRKGEIVWKYDFLRIAERQGKPTRFMKEFLNERSGAAYFI